MWDLTYTVLYQLVFVDNVVDWIMLSNTSAGFGIPVNYWTEYDCFTFCRYRSDCVAVDFDSNTQPPCWMHVDSSELSPENVYSTQNIVQYRLNKTNGVTESWYFTSLETLCSASI